MRNKLFDNLPKTVKLSTGKWLYVSPDTGEGYALYDPLAEQKMGRILFDDSDHWIYDGELLSVGEQEEVAGAINGHEQEMNNLIATLKNDQLWPE